MRFHAIGVRRAVTSLGRRPVIGQDEVELTREVWDFTPFVGNIHASANQREAEDQRGDNSHAGAGLVKESQAS